MGGVRAPLRAELGRAAARSTALGTRRGVCSAGQCSALLLGQQAPTRGGGGGGCGVLSHPSFIAVATRMLSGWCIDKLASILQRTREGAAYTQLVGRQAIIERTASGRAPPAKKEEKYTVGPEHPGARSERTARPPTSKAGGLDPLSAASGPTRQRAAALGCTAPSPTPTRRRPSRGRSS